MKNIKSLIRESTQLLSVACVLALALTLNYVSAWTAPTENPPVGNIAAPQNTGTTSQMKSGNVAAPLNTGPTPQVKNGNISVGRSTNTASDFGLISYGKVRSTVGGFQFPDGTVQTTAAGGAAAAKKYCPMVDPSKSFPTPQYIRCGSAENQKVYTMADISGGQIHYKDAQNSEACHIYYSAADGSYASFSGCAPDANCQQSLTTIASDSLNRCDI